MLPTKFAKHSVFYLVIGISIMGCQHTSPPPPSVEVPQFSSTTYSMAVKGQRFIIDIPWDDKQTLQQQQDELFTSINEYDKEAKSIHKYVKVEKLADGPSQYILKSGLQAESVEHNFDTFLQFTLKTDCKYIQTTLYCEYKAIDGLYSVDLPTSASVQGEQTPAQMEKNEILTLSKFMNHQLKVTDTFKTSLPLSKLKAILTKQHFLVDVKKPNLYLSRLQYNYDVELSQEKINKQYLVTARYYINSIHIDAYHADYVSPLSYAKKDLKKAMNQ